ncbi:MAG: rhodanese-like domain-containing protein [Chitinophagales bacterium]
MFSIFKNFFSDKQKAYKDLNINDFKAACRNNALIIDVRTPAEFEIGKIAGAQNINVASFNFLKEAKALDNKKNVLVYCKSGGRSARAANMLTKIGFENVFNLKGGILAWQKNNEKIVR